MVLQRGATNKRRGYLNALEMLFVLPVLVLVILAMVEFSMVLSMQTRLAAAAREGVREAVTGGPPEQVYAAIERVLGRQRMKHATVRIQPEYSQARPLPHGQPVEVIVEVKSGHVVPDLLGWIGLSIRNQSLVGRAVMRVE